MQQHKTTSKAMHPRRSRTMPPPGLQIYLRSRLTLNFDLLTPKLNVSCRCPVDHLCHLHQNRFVYFHKFGIRRMKE